MTLYYLNKNQQDNKDHEVHTKNCSFLPHEDNREYLGNFFSCKAAISEAEERHPLWKINGCYYCSNDCHTS